MAYRPTIGLEVHAELKTRTKMFCDSPNDPGEKRPNVNVCPVCLGHPGTLPVPNKEAIAAVIKVGLALGADIAETTKFDRKNYFYPDLPKGYQISQYDMPLVKGGALAGVPLTRIHLEEDTGTSKHIQGGPSPDKKDSLLEPGGPSAYSGRPASTLVDFNRAGVPLMELVTEPDIHDAETALRFARELQLILRYLGVSEANMEKGQMRVEVNISLQLTAKSGEPEGPLGTKVEVKNINSFKAVEGAILYEIKRQTEVLESGGRVAQETRGWDDIKRITVSQRSKESAHDYRYFPEPDIPPFETSVFEPGRLMGELPELPEAKRIRFMEEFGLTRAQAETLTDNLALANFYEKAASELRVREKEDRDSPEERKGGKILLYNYLTTDLKGLMLASGAEFDEKLKVTPEHLAHLADLIADGKIMSRQAKDILAKMFADGRDPEAIMKDEGLETVSDSGELENVVRKIIEKNSKAVADYKAGKEASLQFLVGQAMRELKGRGEPNFLRAKIIELLS